MTVKEAHTSDPVKQLLVRAPGVDEDKWEQTYKGETGGVLTVQSELGERIHKIATRGIKLWKVRQDGFPIMISVSLTPCRVSAYGYATASLLTVALKRTARCSSEP